MGSDDALVDKKIGLKLKMRRVSLGITQGGLGSMLGVTFQQIQKYEKGINKINVQKLQQLCKILNTPLSYFLSEENDYYMTGILNDVKKKDGSGNSCEDEDRVPEKDVIVFMKYFSKIKNKKLRNSILTLIRTAGRESSTEK